MELYYRGLGVAALVGERLSRHRVNLIPASTLLLLCPLVALGFAAQAISPDNGAADLATRAGFAVGAFAAGALSLFALPAMVARYVVFRPDQQPITADAAPLYLETGMQVRASGLFCLSERIRQSFLCVPATLCAYANSDLAAYANIDASRKQGFYMIPLGTDDRRGTWTMLIGRSSIRSLRTGTQYLGGDRIPALRFDYTSPGSAGVQSAVMGFLSVDLRDAVAGELARGGSPVPVASRPEAQSTH